jgi:hypothetical protein
LSLTAKRNNIEIKRLNETNAEKDDRLNEDLIRKNRNRSNETELERSLRLQKQREYQRGKRSRETEHEKMIRLQLEKQKRIDKKYNVPTLNIAAVNSAIKNVETLNLGSFNLVCPHCMALYNPLEATTKGVYVRCCENGIMKYYHN